MSRLSLLPLLLLAGFSGCTARTDPDKSAPASQSVTTPTATPAPTVASVNHWKPPQSCPGWAKKDRPAGSNCLGILPQQCGADRAAEYIGQTATPAIRAKVNALTFEEARWIAASEASNDDLRYRRLNVQLDASGRIASVDCF